MWNSVFFLVFSHWKFMWFMTVSEIFSSGKLWNFVSGIFALEKSNMNLGCFLGIFPLEKYFGISAVFCYCFSVAKSVWNWFLSQWKDSFNRVLLSNLYLLFLNTYRISREFWQNFILLPFDLSGAHTHCLRYLYGCVCWFLGFPSPIQTVAFWHILVTEKDKKC